MNKQNLVEAILFLKGESVSKKYIIDTVETSAEELTTITTALREKYSHDSGIVLVESETELGFGTQSDLDQALEKIEKEERGGELSKASLETLAVILYKNGATRSEIDYVRGVNSSFILRNLYLRGLIEKKDNEKDSRSYIYIPTIDTLRYLGISQIQELPSYEEILKTLDEVFTSNTPES